MHGIYGTGVWIGVVSKGDIQTVFEYGTGMGPQTVEIKLVNNVLA